ncbi:MAG: LysE family transporter [Anaerolineales bacterium]|nr:LysE family transporter [Anaerolineales bacterium]MCW5855064.1 LysE family transporter [Anaerolineales bacterium]
MDFSSIAFFLQGAGIGLYAALSPGPFQSLVIAQSLLGGWRRAAPVTFGPLIADIPIATLLVFFISQVPDDFLRFIRLAGAALLIWLAWGLWQEMRSRSQQSNPQAATPQSPWRGLAQGVLMIFLSPGPYLFWALILGPLLLQALGLSWLHAILFLLGFYSFSIGGLQLLALVLGRLGQLSSRGRWWLQAASLALMLGYAAFLAYSGLKGQS